MAYSNSTSDRMDELRFRSQQSPRNESSLLGLVSPPRNGTRQHSQPLHALPQDGRGGLMRRFTTDSSRVPTMSSLTSHRGVQEPQEYGPSVSSNCSCLSGNCPSPSHKQYLHSLTVAFSCSSYSPPCPSLLNSLANFLMSQTYHKVQLVRGRISFTPGLHTKTPSSPSRFELEAPFS